MKKMGVEWFQWMRIVMFALRETMLLRGLVQGMRKERKDVWGKRQVRVSASRCAGKAQRESNTQERKAQGLAILESRARTRRR